MAKKRRHKEDNATRGKLGQYFAFVAALSCAIRRFSRSNHSHIGIVREAVDRLVRSLGSHLVHGLFCNFAMIARLDAWTVLAVDISAYNADHTFFFIHEKRRALRVYIFL